MIDVHEQLKTELAAVKEDLGVVKLELKNEQRILPILKRFKALLGKTRESAQLSLRTSLGNIDAIIERVNHLIKILQEDEKMDIAIIKEDRHEIQEMAGNLGRLWKSHEIDLFRTFRILREEEGNKERLEIKHIDFLKQMNQIIIEINKNLSISHDTGEEVHTVFRELLHFFSQLKVLIRKEKSILNKERKAMR